MFDGVLNFWWCSFVESLPNSAVMPELLNWSVRLASLASIIKKNKNFNKMVTCSHHYPSSLVYLGYTFGLMIQAQAILPHCWGSAPPVTTDNL